MMNKILVLWGFVFLSPVFALSTQEKIPAASTLMKNIDGRELSLKSLKGKAGLLVVFTCNSCPVAKKWWAAMAEVGRDYAAKGFGVVAVNSNDPKASAEDDFETMKVRAKDLGFPYVVDATSSVARAFGASRTPEVYLFNAKDELVYQGAIGEEPSRKPYKLAIAMDDLLAGRKIESPNVKAVGCSIRFR